MPASRASSSVRSDATARPHRPAALGEQLHHLPHARAPSPGRSSCRAPPAPPRPPRPPRGPSVTRPARRSARSWAPRPALARPGSSCLAPSATSWNSSSSIARHPGLCVELDPGHGRRPPRPSSRCTVAVVSTLSGSWPARPSSPDSAIEKHPAWAAAISSSGLVPVALLEARLERVRPLVGAAAPSASSRCPPPASRSTAASRGSLRHVSRTSGVGVLPGTVPVPNIVRWCSKLLLTIRKSDGEPHGNHAAGAGGRLGRLPQHDRDARPSTSATRSACCSCRARATSSPAWARSPRWSSACACPAAAAPWRWPACTAASRGAAHTDPAGDLRVEVDPAPRRRAGGRPAPATSSASTAPWSRRSSSCAATTAASRAFVRSITEPGALADTSGYSPDLELRAEGRAARDARRDRAAREGARAPARAPDRAAGARAASATTCSPAPRSSSASTSCASRWSRSARSWARTTPRWPRSTARRSRRPACPRPCASRPSRSSAGSSAWASSRARAR